MIPEAAKKDHDFSLTEDDNFVCKYKCKKCNLGLVIIRNCIPISTRSEKAFKQGWYYIEIGFMRSTYDYMRSTYDYCYSLENFSCDELMIKNIIE
jgi:hypothetical protein